MSLQAFQRALADLIASPQLCLALRRDAQATLQSYDLTPLERRRLIEVVWQRGMSLNCTLYRTNRITPLYTLLKLTCYVLGDDFVDEAERYWEAHEATNLFKREIDQFGAFLKRRIQEGQVKNPYLEEVLDFELAVYALRWLPRRQIARTVTQSAARAMQSSLHLHPLVRVVRFRHDPEVLLQHLGEKHVSPSEMVEGEFFLLLDGRGDDVSITKLDSSLGTCCHELAHGTGNEFNSQTVESLIEAGLLVGSNLV